MEKNIILALSLILTIVSGSVYAALISHYTFDEQNNSTTPDTVGTSYATLGDRVAINTTLGVAKVGDGVLEMNGGGAINNDPSEAAVTSNSFSWANDARTITFWWKAKSPNVNTLEGAFISFGGNAGSGTRFEVKEQSASTGAVRGSLRVEVQGTGQNSTPSNFDDGSWHFVAVVVPDDATFKDIKWYVDGGSTNLNTSTNTIAIATETAPLVFGDSVVNDTRTPPVTDRVAYGYLDDFQLYNEVLTLVQIQSLYDNPGSVIGQQLPDVDAGDDWSTWSSEAVTMNATVVNNTDAPVLPLTYRWTVDAASLADTNLDIVLTDADQEDATVQVTKVNPTGNASLVTLTLAANNQGSGSPDVVDHAVIEVYDDACQAGLSTDAITTDLADLNDDCVTDIEDLADMLTEWLSDYSLTEPYLL